MAELSARWVGGAARPGQAGLVLGSSGQSSARFVDKEHSLRWTRAELQVPLAHPPLGAGGSPGAEQHVWGHPSQERSDVPCSAPQRSHRGIENTLFCSGGERGVLCPSRTNLRQSPQSPAREVSSFVFSLWCLTNRASFSGECIVAQLTGAGPLGGRMLERMLRGVLSSQPCRVELRASALPQRLVEASVRLPQLSFRGLGSGRLWTAV